MSVLSADDKIALLTDLLDRLGRLPLLDEIALDAFKRRGEMVLCNIYATGTGMYCALQPSISGCIY